MKVNLIGAGTGTGINTHLSDMLLRAGHEAYVNSINPEYFDVTVFCGLWHLDWKTNSRQDFYKKPTIALAVGSDVYRDLGVNRDMSSYLMRVDKVLIADEAMREKVKPYNENIEKWHTPIDTYIFNVDDFKAISRIERERDCLLYCAAPDHQDLSQILDFVEDNPSKTFTLIGRGYQDFIMETYDNMLSIRYVPYEAMPYVMLRHKEYRSFFTRNMDLIGKMACEALMMGLKAYANNVEIKKIPEYMWPETAIPRLVKILEEVTNR